MKSTIKLRFIRFLIFELWRYCKIIMMNIRNYLNASIIALKSRLTKINLLFSWGILRNCLILLTASVIPLTPVFVIKIKKFPSLNDHFCLIKGVIGNYIYEVERRAAPRSETHILSKASAKKGKLLALATTIPFWSFFSSPDTSVFDLVSKQILFVDVLAGRNSSSVFVLLLS